MSQIQVKNVTFCYESSYENVFENLTFHIDTDWRLGLIGKNGKGKTTFLKLLLNEYQYQGKIEKTVECEYFPFAVKNEEEITIELIKSLAPEAQEWQIEKELNAIHADSNILYRPFQQLSGGEKVKVLLISLFLRENNFLLIDEPTNHLDTETAEEVEKYLNTKKGFIVVSHDRSLLNHVVDHIISINNKTIDIQQGNYDSWKENKDREDSFEINKNEKLKKDIIRLTEAAKQASGWSDEIEKTKYNYRISGLRPDTGYIGHQSAKMMKRAKSIEDRKSKEIEEKEKLLKNIDRADDLTMKPLIFEKKQLVALTNFTIKYEEKALFTPLHFEINDGDRVAFVGKNGSGKTSIIKALLKQEVPYEGTISVANNIKISYVSQHTEEVKGSLSDYARKYNVEEAIFRAMLQKLGVNTAGFERDLSSLSEGQKKKILLARSISESADLYIWDEPLNYIDVFSREQIEKMLLKYKPTIVFVEHDEMFRQKIATKIIELI